VTETRAHVPTPTADRRRGSRSLWGWLLLGVGFGGVLDGIVLHQVLQWHHLTSHGEMPSNVAGLRAEVLADGLFHAATWALVVVGLVLVLRDRASQPPRVVVGLLVAGWGLVNLVEGVINHQLLGLHHVRDDLGGPLSWDLGFLAVSVALLGGGLLLARPRRT
jgi:uncharacterized membrane protein